MLACVFSMQVEAVLNARTYAHTHRKSLGLAPTAMVVGSHTSHENHLNTHGKQQDEYCSALSDNITSMSSICLTAETVYVHLYVCVCVCVHTYVYVYIYIYIYIHIYHFQTQHCRAFILWIRRTAKTVHMCVYVCIYIYIYIYIYI